MGRSIGRGVCRCREAGSGAVVPSYYAYDPKIILFAAASRYVVQPDVHGVDLHDEHGLRVVFIV